jgi:hypothetical protein
MEQRNVLENSLCESGNNVKSKFMTDLIYILVVVAFFVISGVYVRFCEKL